MSTLANPPQVRELDRRDINSILSRNCVARLAFAWGGRIDMRPIHFVYCNDRIYGRTSPGDKFVELDPAHAAPVAFEVDEVESIWRWRSVIVRGEFRVLTPESAGSEEWNHAAEMLRRLVRQTFLNGDPFPDRTLVFRVDIGEVTGRAMG